MAEKAEIILSAKDQTAAAFEKAKAGLASMQAAAASTSVVFGSLGLALAASFEAVTLKGAIDAADQLSKLEQKTGIAVEALSALRYAGKLSDVSVDDLATGLKKLGNSMADAAGGSKDASAAFDAIGVKVKTAGGALRASNEVLGDIADKFAGYEDGAGKAALATALFGKNGAALIPLLNQGRRGLSEMTREAELLGVAFGGDLAKQSEAFNDNLTRLGAAAEGAKFALLETLLPALTKITNEFIDARKAYGSFSGGFLDALRGSTAEGDLANTRTELDKLNTSLAALEEKRARLQNVQGAPFVPPEHINQLKEQIALLQKRKQFQELQQTRAALAAGEGILDERRFRGPSKTPAPTPDKTGGAAKDASISELNALLDKIKQRIEADKQQLTLNRQLTESEKFALDVETQLGGAKTKLTDAQKKAVLLRLAEVKALDQLLETRNMLRAAADAEAKAEQETIASLQAANFARAEENQALLDQLAIFGKTGREIEALRIARLENALAVKQGNIATAIALEAGGAEILLLRERAALLQQQIDKRKELAGRQASAEDDPAEGVNRALQKFNDNLKKGGDAAFQAMDSALKGLQDGITDVLTGKQVDAGKIVDNIIAEFLRLKVVGPLIGEIFGDGRGNSGLIGSAFSFLTGLGGKAGGGRVTAGQAVITGERGRELFVPQVNGSIVTASALNGMSSGPSVVQTFNVGAGVTRGEVMALMQGYGAQLKGEILQSVRNGGAFAR